MTFWVGQAKGYDASGTDSLTCKGYRGIGYDGEYNYYAPCYDGSSYHGRVLRQKVMAVFDNADTWDAYNAGSTDSLTCKGYSDVVYDGRYMYFVPDYNGAYHGVVLRYDTTKPFKSADSWDAYNAAAIDSLDCKGFSGGAFDGQFIYFIPDANGAYNNVLRYDTTKPFKSASSWTAYAIGSMASGNAKGYWGGVVAQGFLFLSPHQFTASPAVNGYHGNLIRFDTTKPFKSASSWESYNVAAINSNLKRLGYPCTDGKFVYFGEYGYGYVLRYDLDKPFDASGSYSYFNLGSMIYNPSCFLSCIQGHYLVLAGGLAEIAVCNLEAPFSAGASWAFKQCRVSRSTIGGFKGIRADLNYVYLSPYNYYYGYNGKVGRIRVNPCPGSSAPAPGSTENLNEYAINCMTTSSSRATASSIEMDGWASCYQDYGYEFFDAVEAYFEVYLGSIITGDPMFPGVAPNPIDIYLVSLSSIFSEMPGEDFHSNDVTVCFYITFDSNGNVNGRYLRLKGGNSGSYSSTYAISGSTTYYLKLLRSGTTVYLYIYSDANRTNLLAALSLGISTQKWRFIYASRGHNDTDIESLTMSWWVQNLQIADW